MHYSIGIDLGGTNIVAAVVDEDFKIIKKANLPTRLPRKPEEIADDMARAAKEAAEKSGIPMQQIKVVGIGSPGCVDSKSGMISYSCNLDFYDVPITSMLKERLGISAYVENDANAAALGEYIAGAGKEASDMVAVTLGTGVGGGIILDRKIFTGFNHAAGELGHMVIQMDGRPCNCGRKGCFEAYASATGLIKTTREAMEKDKRSKLWQIAGSLEKVDGKTAFDGMRLKDATAQKVVDLYIRQLAVGIINIENIFQPQVICIGGGISKEGDALIQPLTQYVDREVYTKNLPRSKRTKIVAARLGNDAGLIGAAHICDYL